jgi:spore maturation protein CgeB
VDLNFELYDLIVSSLPNILDLAVSHGIACEYLKLAFEPRMLERLHRHPNPWKVVHIGGYGPVHDERNALLEEVARQIPMDFWGYGVDNLGSNSRIRERYHGEAWGLKMHEIRHNSLIVLTGHISKVADGFANNMTLYEATGVGACLVTDLKENLPKIFEPEQEVVTYRYAEECAERVRYLLDHEEERARIAKRGQERTLREHTYCKRMKELAGVLQKHLSISGRSRMRSAAERH